MTQLAGAELELTDEQKSVLTDEAENFLRACGSIPWGEWASLGAESKAAFIIAGNRIRLEQAKMTAEEVVRALETDGTNDEKGTT